MNLLQRLKIETALAHDRIEQAFDLGARTSSRSAYRDLLARLYGFHAAWEPWAEAALAHAGFFHGRRKVDLLIADLHELGMTDRDMGQLALCVPTVPMRTQADAFGSMYVVEGSTLGGILIARTSSAALALGSTMAAATSAVTARRLVRCGKLLGLRCWHTVSAGRKGRRNGRAPDL